MKKKSNIKVFASGKAEFQSLFGINPKQTQKLILQGMPCFQFSGEGNYYFPVEECKKWLLLNYAPSTTIKTISQLNKIL